MRFSSKLVLLLFLPRLLSITVAAIDAPEPTKTCFQCDGTGMMKCPAPGCVKGTVPCPGLCLRMSRGNWHHEKVAGHSDTDLWITFQNSDGSTLSWNQNHVGDVIVMQNGKAVDIGRCPICHGSGHAPCKVCKGSGEVTCTICDGKKVVPVSWTAFDNPKLKDRPKIFTLKDGRVIIGRSIMISGSNTTIRTEKDKIEVKTSDILSETKQLSLK